jgi:hypothetical protein
MSICKQSPADSADCGLLWSYQTSRAAHYNSEEVFEDLKISAKAQKEEP